MRSNKKTLIITLAVFIFASAFFTQYQKESYSETGAPTKILTSPCPFENLELEAKSAYVFDMAKNEPIFDFNAKAQLPLASLTKIMTIVIAEEKIPEWGKTEITETINAALVKSSNEAASAIAAVTSNFINQGSFVDAMNKKATTLKLRQTYFLNETGLDISENLSGAYGSAENVAKLLTYAVANNPKVFEITRYASLQNDEIELMENTNPYAVSTTQLMISKTGLTDLAGGNLAIIFDAGLNHPIVAVVLGSTKEGRFTDTQKLIDATFEYLRK